MPIVQWLVAHPNSIFPFSTVHRPPNILQVLFVRGSTNRPERLFRRGNPSDVRSSCINGNQREECVRMPRKMARQTLRTPCCFAGSRPYLATSKQSRKSLKFSPLPSSSGESRLTTDKKLFFDRSSDTLPTLTARTSKLGYKGFGGTSDAAEQMGAHAWLVLRIALKARLLAQRN
jgi:hypothetical protein